MTNDLPERMRAWSEESVGYKTALLRQAADEIERLRSLTTWQPIETAPKDGTRFWGNVGDDAISMLWHDGFGEFVSEWRRMEFAKGFDWEGDGPSGEYTDGRRWHDHSPTIHHPTHWLPLPTPPEADT